MENFMEEQRAAEARARRGAKRVGLCAIKSRARTWSINNQCGWRVIDPFHNVCLHGERFELSPEDVIALCGEYE
jgi:hypothetical protein